MNQIRYLMMA